MTERDQKELLKSMLIGMMPKYALVKIPKVFSPELNSMVDEMVNEILDVMKKNLTNKDYLLSIVELDWSYYFHKINKQLYILNKKNNNKQIK